MTPEESKKKQPDGSNHLPELNQWLKVWGVLWVVVSLAVAVAAVIWHTDKWPETLIVTLLVVGFGLPFIPHITRCIEVSEIEFPWLHLKGVKREVTTVRQRQLLNQSVMTIDAAGEKKWFWIDKHGRAHKLPDFTTAQFLARDKGIVKVEANELELDSDYPPFYTAEPRRSAADNIFILYNGTLYYQSSLAFLFWLATNHKVRFKDKTQLKDWKDEGGNEWIKLVTESDFTKNELA